MAGPPVDLSRLAVDRLPPRELPRRSPLRHRQRWLSLYLLPISILLGFMGLLLVAAGHRLIPSRGVTVMPVIVKRAQLQQAGTSLFQTPGWIEPRPTATAVAALTAGVIEELLVVAGQQIHKGQPVARLIAVDAELALEQATNLLAIRQGELNRAQAELAAAHTRYENPAHLRAPLADAQSTLSKAQTELAKLPFLIEAARSQVEYARLSMLGKQSAQGAVSANSIARAENEHAIATANLQELLQRQPHLAREVAALEQFVQALEQQLDLLVEETRQVGEARAKVESAEAYCQQARLQVRRAELAVERNTVRAPMDGRVLRLVASPGTRVMGLEPTAGQSSSTVIEMYDPGKLQVRADVRLEDIPLVLPGQPVEIQTDSASQLLHGRVLQITSSANIQKNTLEVKVELLDPPTTVRPEMLVTATFLAPKNEAAQAETTEAERMFVPRSLVEQTAAEAFVWIVNDQATAQRRQVQVGNPSGEGLVEIQAGLKVTDKLITSGAQGLREGWPVNVVGDDPTVGIN